MSTAQMKQVPSRGINQSLIERGVGLILKGLGVDLEDQNYLETPERVGKLYAEMFQREDTEYSTFEETDADIVIMKDHRMWTLCPHHLLPVELFVSMAYLPNGSVLGLSKLIRVLNSVNRGPLLQERFTREALEYLHKVLPGLKGAGVLVRGQHHCTKIRGVQSDASFTTYKFTGAMKQERELQDRFFRLLQGGSR